MLLIPTALGSVGLEVLILRGEMLSPKTTVREPPNLKLQLL